MFGRKERRILELERTVSTLALRLGDLENQYAEEVGYLHRRVIELTSEVQELKAKTRNI